VVKELPPGPHQLHIVECRLEGLSASAGIARSIAIIAREAAQLAQCRLLSYPVWGWLLPPEQQIPVNGVTGYKLPNSTHLQAKQSAVAAHASQYSPRSKHPANADTATVA
jgi:hypothetical protein